MPHPFEESWRTLVQSLPGQSALNVAWAVRPSGQPLPAVVCNDVGGTLGASYDGSTGERVTRVQVDVWAGRYADARAITRVIEDNLHAWKGDHGGVRYAGVFILGHESGFEDVGTGVIYLSRLDVRILHQPLED